MAAPNRDVYGGNYPEARELAFARSSYKCQFCGLQNAREAHHWAHPDEYPSGEMVQEYDLTALCETCHELASMMRDWILDKGASMDDLLQDLRFCNTYIAKREVFSFWLYPEDDEKTIVSAAIPESIVGPPEPGSFNDQIHGIQAQISHHKYAREAIKRQMERIEKGESLDTPEAWDDAKWIESDLTLEELNEEYRFLGRQMREAITLRESLRKQGGISGGCRFVIGLFLAGIILFLAGAVFLAIYPAVALPE